ncbi:hypothetical protein [Pseudomonas putida]|uniref:hypothetical protein n=1 Tax=Pseudomonas putida TaxID=303 RepID=UPI000750A46F|nr:hypothetical protein [Pseudomonas putida]
MIKNNRFFIGEITNGKRAISMNGQGIEGNEFRIQKIVGGEDVVSITESDKILDSLSLPRDTSLALLKEAIELLQEIKSKSASEKEKALMKTGLWEYISRSANVSTTVTNLITAAPFIHPMISNVI